VAPFATFQKTTIALLALEVRCATAIPGTASRNARMVKLAGGATWHKFNCRGLVSATE